MSTPKTVFVSGIAVNEIQAGILETVYAIIQGAGMVPLPNPDDAQGISLARRRELLLAADSVVGCSDFPLEPGVEWIIVGGRQSEIQVPFPPPIQALVDRAMVQSGTDIPDLSAKRKAILLPGQTETPMNAPRGMTMRLPPNVAVVQLLSPPQNVTPAVVVHEVTLAWQAQKPLVVLQSVPSTFSGVVEGLAIRILKSPEELKVWAGEQAK
jgi:hypothetical protein